MIYNHKIQSNGNHLKNTHTMVMIPRYCLVASTMEVEEVNLELLMKEEILAFLYSKDIGTVKANGISIDEEGNVVLPKGAINEEAIKERSANENFYS